MITFVSAAYGAFYREFALRGLCNSFSRYVPNGQLVIFVDDSPGWEAPKNCEFRLMPESVNNFLSGSDDSFFARTCIKYDLMKTGVAGKKEGVCWIDADSLVLSDLLSIIDESKINVVSHGSCNPDEEFDCGNGVVVEGREFAIGGIFYLPNQKYVSDLMALALQRSNWKPEPSAYWYSDGEQSLLNHVVQSNHEEVVWLDDSGMIANWEFLEKRHPYPFDKGISSISHSNGFFYANNKRFALLSWSSLTLRRHIKQGFRSLNPQVARIFRDDFYGIKSGPYPVLLQYLYTAYDFLNLGKTR